MKIDTFDILGKKNSIDISEKVFSAKVNEKLISHVFYSQNSNAKLRLAKTKVAIIGLISKIAMRFEDQNCSEAFGR